MTRGFFCPPQHPSIEPIGHGRRDEITRKKLQTKGNGQLLHNGVAAEQYSS